jgi:hypothetical protein
MLQLELDLLGDRQRPVRQETCQPEGVTLLTVEREVLREQTGTEEGRSAQPDPRRPAGGDVVEGGGQ